MCHFVEVGVALLEEACHWGKGGKGSDVSDAQAMPSVSCLSFLLPADQDVGLSAPSPEPCGPACCHAPHNDNGLSL